jgi:hypothetical protein
VYVMQVADGAAGFGEQAMSGAAGHRNKKGK